jgi:hypothetical protein
MRRLLPVLTTFALLSLVACRPAAVVTDGPIAPAGTVSATEVGPGTTMEVRLQQQIGVTTNQVGDTFTAEVVEPLRTPAGHEVIPAGTVVDGRISGLAPAAEGRPAAVRVEFERIHINGQAHPFAARVIDTGARTVPDAILSTEAAIGAAAGAALGLIIEGNLLSILVGGVLGAGVGTAIALGRGQVEPVLPAGTRLTLQTTDRVAIR